MKRPNLTLIVNPYPITRATRAANIFALNKRNKTRLRATTKGGYKLEPTPNDAA